MQLYRRLSIIGFLFYAQCSLGAPMVRPECTEWKQKIDEVMGKQSSVTEFDLAPNKSISDLISTIKKYPGSTPFSIGPGDHQDFKATVDRALSIVTCNDAAYFEAVKKFFISSKPTTSQKEEVLSALLNLIASEDDQSPNLIEHILKIKLVETAIETKLLKLSDSAYFEFGSIRKETDILKFSLRAGEAWSFDCVKKKSCSDQNYHTMFSALLRESDGAKPIKHWFAWWAKRVK